VDGIVNLTQTSTVGSWGLDRIDQRLLPLNGDYVPAGAQGQGVDVFVLDTGADRSCHVAHLPPAHLPPAHLPTRPLRSRGEDIAGCSFNLHICRHPHDALAVRRAGVLPVECLRGFEPDRRRPRPWDSLRRNDCRLDVRRRPSSPGFEHAMRPPVCACVCIVRARGYLRARGCVAADMAGSHIAALSRRYGRSKSSMTPGLGRGQASCRASTRSSRLAQQVTGRAGPAPSVRVGYRCSTLEYA
jgi:hypothetical protein